MTPMAEILVIRRKDVFVEFDFMFGSILECLFSILLINFVM